MKKEFLINIIFLLGINLLIKPLYLFGVDLHIQNMVGVDTYGMYKVLFNIAFLLQFVHEPGIQAYNSQNIAKNPDQLGFHLPKILGLKVALGFIFFILTISYFLLKGYDSSLLPLMIVVTANLFLSTLFIYLRTNIAGIGKYRIDSFLSTIDKVLMLLILGVLSWVSPFQENFQIIWLAYGQMAAFGISCIVALGILYKHLGNIGISFSWSYSKNLLKWSAPYALIILTMAAYTRMDSVMLEHILDDGGRESGIYEYGYRFLDALNMIGYLFAALLLPMYAANIKDRKIINDLVDLGLRLMVLVTFVGAAAMITYRHEVMQWANSEATPYYGDILLYLMLSFISVSIAFVFGSLLVANNNLKHFNILLIGGVVLNFVLNYYMIPDQHALGAAKATLITQTVITAGQIFLAITFLKLKINRRLLFIVLGFGLFCIVNFGSIYAYLPMNWIIRAALSISFSLIAALGIKLIDIKMLIDLISKKNPI